MEKERVSVIVFDLILYFRYWLVGISFYSPHLGTRKQLGEGLESCRGFYHSIKPTQMGLSLNIGMYIFYLDISVRFSLLSL